MPPLFAATGRPLTLSLLAALFAAGCSPPADPVMQVIEDVRTAAEDRDALAVAERLAEDFRGQGGIDRAEVVATLRRYFAAYENVNVAVYDVSVARPTESDADVSCRVEFTGAARRIGGLDGFLPPSAVVRFDVRLVRRGSDWKVVSAEWREVQATAGRG